MRKLPLLLTVVLAASFTAGARAAPVAVVSHFDAAPASADQVYSQLVAYTAETRRDRGNRSVDLKRETVPGHFTVREVWADRRAFDEHTAAEHTRRFHLSVTPLLEHPMDEQLEQRMRGSDNE